MKRSKLIFLGIAVFIVLIIGIFLAGYIIKSDRANSKKKITKEDYSEYFNEMDGCAVFRDDSNNCYYIYNYDLAQIQTAPASSFKIISCLMGLESGAIDPSDSIVSWDGTVYPVKEWNQDLDYKNAFKFSAIWYYRGVLDKVGQEYVQQTLNKLNYGNKDISQWEGSMNNMVFPAIKGLKSINGFWQESSLLISPIEQVDVINEIFEKNEVFSSENINLVKNVMLAENDNSDIQIYGKTGTGIKDDSWSDAWYVGYFEKDGQRIEFAVRINEPGASGQDAKKIAIQIIDGRFSA